MSTSAIKVEGLWKEYAIGAAAPQKTFREMLTNGISSPVRRLKGEHKPKAVEERFWALRSLDFEIQQGEVVGIVGRNGAGKSTLLKILSRITEPTRGQIKLRGRVASLLEVGTGFHPELTGRENIFLNGAILGMSRREVFGKFDEIVAFAEVDRFIDTPVKHYSSGMYIRLAFSVAAHIHPEILIIDEVLSVGDGAFQKKSLARIKSIAAEGRTVIFVSHHMPLVRGLCQRTLVLERGTLVHQGDTETGIRRYLGAISGEQPKTVDTRNLARPHEIPAKSPARIIQLTVETDRPRPLFLSGEDFVLAFDLEVTQPISDIVLGWALYREGILIFETRSIDSYGPLTYLAEGCYRFVSRVSNISVSPGEYTISVGLRNESISLDYLPEVMSIEVESKKAMSSRWFEEKHGLISVHGQWSEPQKC